MTEFARKLAEIARPRQATHLAIGVLACLALSLGIASVARAASEDAKSDLASTRPLFAVVSIGDQRISIYGKGGLLARSAVSTGKRGHATPTGVFSIVQKRRWHRSNLYSDAPMPFMQRITWSGIALHAGVVPGYPASHGCIRLPSAFAQKIFQATAVGYRVIIAPEDAAPFDIAHRALPAPQFLPAPAQAFPDATGAMLDGIDHRAVGVVKAASLDEVSLATPRLNPVEVAQAMKSKANADAKAAAQALRLAKRLIGKKSIELRAVDRKLSRAEERAKNASRAITRAVRQIEDDRGREAIAEAAEEKAEAEVALEQASKAGEGRIAAASEALTQAEQGLSEAQQAAEKLRLATVLNTESQGDGVLDQAQAAEDIRLSKAMAAKMRSEAELAKVRKAEERQVAKAAEAKERADKALTQKQTSEEKRIAAATSDRTEAEGQLSQAQTSAEEMRAAKEAVRLELAAARKAVVEAKAAGNAAAKAITEAGRRLKPLSVFISRKTGRLYVRQDFEPLFDAPVSILDPERSLGTHVFISTHAAEEGSQLQWQAVSMPAGAARKPRGRKSAEPAQDGDEPLEPAPAPETAAGALDRIVIPDDISQRLAELVWVGATIIVSDQGISGETGSTTDFIILTK